MKRRDFLKAAAASAFLAGTSAHGGFMSRKFFGFLPTEDFNNPTKLGISDVSPVGGTGAGRIVLLYKLWERAIEGPTVPRDQGNGLDCVGQSTARAVDVIQGVQVSGMGLPFKIVAPACASTIYGGSRVEIAEKRHGYRMFGPGSHVPFAAEFVRDYGALYMKPYPEQGVDLSEHSWARSADWGASGVPDELEPIAVLHGIKSYAPCKGWRDVIDSIANGYPVVVGSNFGFTGQDRDGGYLTPRGSWSHAMVWTGYDDLSARKGALCENSWGADWVKGDKLHDQPDGSFWTDADVVEDMCRRGEAIAVSGHNGFPIQKVPNYVLW